MSDGAYAFGERGAPEEEDRLAAVEQAFDFPTQNALIEIGVQAGSRCWEVGAGRGSIARWLRGVVGSEGTVLATDLHEEWFDRAGTDVRFRRHDVVRDPVPARDFDLVHARFLLEHVPDPRGVTARLADALRPGGVIVLEDSAGLDWEVRPRTPVFEGFAAAWEQAGHAVGWNPAYGNDLMSDLAAAGLVDLRGRQYRQLAPGGAGWAHVAYGIERLGPELRAQGIAGEHIDAVLRCLADPQNLITGPPVAIAWGRRAD